MRDRCSRRTSSRGRCRAPRSRPQRSPPGCAAGRRRTPSRRRSRWPTAATARSTPPSPPASTGSPVDAAGPTGRAASRRATRGAATSRWSSWPASAGWPCSAATSTRSARPASALGRRSCAAALDAGRAPDRPRRRRQRQHRRRRRAAAARSAPGCSTRDGRAARPRRRRAGATSTGRPRPGCTRGWPTVELVVAATSTTRCCGPNGAAAVYGPQKGATRRRRSPSSTPTWPAGRPWSPRATGRRLAPSAGRRRGRRGRLRRAPCSARELRPGIELCSNWSASTPRSTAPTW